MVVLHREKEDVVSELVSLKGELHALKRDLVRSGDDLSEWGYDCLVNRIEALESMIEFEKAGF
jgi:hypothetical protein